MATEKGRLYWAPRIVVGAFCPCLRTTVGLMATFTPSNSPPPTPDRFLNFTTLSITG